MNVDQDLLAVFKAEVEEQIDDLCQWLGADPSSWQIDKLFRLSHNIKGAARIVGADGVREAAHALEDLFGAVRDGLDLDPGAVALARRGADLLDACFAAMEDGEGPDVEEFKYNVDSFLRTMVKPEEEDSTAGRTEGARTDGDMAPAPQMMGDDQVRDIFLHEVGEFVTTIRHRLSKPPSRWNMAGLKELCSQVEMAAGIAAAESIQSTARGLGEVLEAVERRTTVSSELVALAREGGSLVEACFNAFLTDDEVEIRSFLDRVGSRVRIPDREGDSSSHSSAEAKTLRVAVEKLDGLMGITSDFVLEVFRADERSAQSGRLVELFTAFIASNPTLRSDPAVKEITRLGREIRKFSKNAATRMSQLSDQFQETVRSLRMVRVDSLTSPLNRAVREAVRMSGHTAELKIEGSDTEVDRAVLEELRDPLVHLIRNAVGHGIEAPSERLSKRKAEAGEVVLKARSAGAWVEISVADDGRGIDPSSVRALAIKKKFATAEELSELTDGETLDLLLRPGFTTVGKVSELAGRGVGLDVVASNLLKLGGSVSISSIPGQGSTFVLKVPLTRLTTRGLVVQIAGQYFAVPIADVERTLRIDSSTISSVDGIDVVEIDGGLVPVTHLAAFLGMSSEASPTCPGMILQDGRRRRLLLADRILGEREFIVQPLVWNLEGVPGFTGTTVLDGGRLVFVLDSRQLVDASVVDGATATSGRFDRTSMRRYNVLVVDDSVTSRTLEKNILSAAGYEVATAVNGQEGFDRLAETEIDLAVIDVEMPLMDGLELTRKIRVTEGLRDLPIILVTSLGSRDDQRRGAEAGADAYIVKGEFDQDELLRTVSRLL